MLLILITAKEEEEEDGWQPKWSRAFLLVHLSGEAAQE